jgi:hypothetical protein
MRAPEGFTTTFSAAGTKAIADAQGESLKGGLYEVSAVCGTWGSASLQLQRLGPDGSTYGAIGSPITSNYLGAPTAPLYLPEGTYEWVLTNAPGSSLVAGLQRVPRD